MDFQQLVSKMICIVNEWTMGRFPCRIKTLEDFINGARSSISNLQVRLGNLESAFNTYPSPVADLVRFESVPTGANPLVTITFPQYIDIKSVLPLLYTNAESTNPVDYEMPVISSYWTETSGTNMIVNFQILGTITDGEFSIKFFYKPL
jgi:hypothetical protein